MGFIQWLENAISFIQKSQHRHQTAGETIRKIGEKKENENKLTQKINKKTLSQKIAGVDSGFIHQSFHSFDLMMLRTVGVCFEYKEGKLVQTKYYPKAFDLPQPIIDQRGLEREEFGRFVSLTRLQSEIQTGIQLIQEFKPQTLFLDGSIIPHPADKPAKESPLNELYKETIQLFETLYETSEKNNCFLIGSIEDSRSNRLIEIIREEWLSEKEKNMEGIEKMNDSPLMDNVLKEKERSMAFTIAKNNSKHPIIMDFQKKWGEKMLACYIKPSKWDFPLRIEFLQKGEKEETADWAASIAFSQSSLHKEYAYPAVLIEADLRAGLKQEEISMVTDQLFSKIGRHNIHSKRRDKRPF